MKRTFNEGLYCTKCKILCNSSADAAWKQTLCAECTDIVKAEMSDSSDDEGFFDTAEDEMDRIGLPGDRGEFEDDDWDTKYDVPDTRWSDEDE